MLLYFKDQCFSETFNFFSRNHWTTDTAGNFTRTLSAYQMLKINKRPYISCTKSTILSMPKQTSYFHCWTRTWTRTDRFLHGSHSVFFFLATLLKMTTMQKHDIQMSLSFYSKSTKIIVTCANIHNGSWMSGLLSSSSSSSFATIATDKMSTMKNLKKKNVWRLEFHKLTQFFFRVRVSMWCVQALYRKKKREHTIEFSGQKWKRWQIGLLFWCD